MMVFSQPSSARRRWTMSQRIGIRTGLLAASASAACTLCAAPLPVPNHSFEVPQTSFANPEIDSWQKTPKPDWYDESGGFLWNQLSGVFANTPAGSEDHIDNVEGGQALFLFAVPQVGIFLEPAEAFNLRFEPGRSYRLTVGVVGGGGGMAAGTSLQISLFYREGDETKTVASTDVVHDPALFPTTTHLVDVTVDVPSVQPGDPWAGQDLGVQFLSTVRPDLAVGGYWDLDNVRLSEVEGPVLSAPEATAGRFEFTVQSAPGAELEVLVSNDPSLPIASWTSLQVFTNVSGTTSVVDEAASSEMRFYQVRQLP